MNAHLVGAAVHARDTLESDGITFPQSDAEIEAFNKRERERLRELLALDAEAAPQPALASWKAVAEALGVSDDTLHRRRQDRRDDTAPYFADANAARLWYAALLGPKRGHRPQQTTRREAIGLSRGREVATGEPTLAALRRKKSR